MIICTPNLLRKRSYQEMKKNNKYSRYNSFLNGGVSRKRWNFAHGNYNIPSGETFATFYKSVEKSGVVVDLGSGYSVAITDDIVDDYSRKDVLAVYAILQATGFNDQEIGKIIDDHMKKLGV